MAMNSKTRLWSICFVLMILLVTQTAWAENPPAELKKDLDAAVKTFMDSGDMVGLAVGIIKDGKTYVLGYGETKKGNKTKPDGNTIFSIGSISKVFSTTLLADMVKDGLIKLDDPIETVFPNGTKVAAKDGKKITFRHLATHTSGLPRLGYAFMFSIKDQKQPYKYYTQELLYKDLTGTLLLSEPGTTFLYSNFGSGLLGHALSLKENTDYESLLKKRIFNKLKMEHSMVTLTESQQKSLAQGYGGNGEEMPVWDIPTLPGAGAIKSNVNDMLLFMRANLGVNSGSEALTEVLRQCHPVVFKDQNNAIGLGWITIEKLINGKNLVWHNGQTGGYSAFAGFVKENGTAVVVLSNKSQMVDWLGIEILKILDK